MLANIDLFNFLDYSLTDWFSLDFKLKLETQTNELN